MLRRVGNFAAINWLRRGYEVVGATFGRKHELQLILSSDSIPAEEVARNRIKVHST